LCYSKKRKSASSSDRNLSVSSDVNQYQTFNVSYYDEIRDNGVASSQISSPDAVANDYEIALEQRVPQPQPQQQQPVTSSNVAETDDDDTDLTVIDNDLYERQVQGQGQGQQQQQNSGSTTDYELTLIDNDLYR